MCCAIQAGHDQSGRQNKGVAELWGKGTRKNGSVFLITYSLDACGMLEVDLLLTNAEADKHMKHA